MANPILDQIKLSGVTYDIIDSTAIHSMDGYWTSAQTESAITAATGALAEVISEELSAKTDVSAFTAHTADTNIHVTVADKEAWNAKLDEADVASLFGNVAYDSTTQRINFYHESTSGTVLAYVDASDFVKDGFLESVTIENKTISGESVPCLVFVWNTDSGLQETDIPLSGIFDPSNYYTKTEVDEAISAATSGKSDISAVTAVNDVLTAHTANTDIHVTTTDKSTWSGKQDALVSGTNIKTINNQSILGSGNLEVQSLPTVSGTTLIFS